MANCTVCNLALVDLGSPREKKFCSASCRSKYWQKNKPKMKIHKVIGPEVELTEESVKFVKTLHVEPKINVMNLTPDQSKEVLETAKNDSKWIRREVPKPPPGLTANQQILWKKEHGVK